MGCEACCGRGRRMVRCFAVVDEHKVRRKGRSLLKRSCHLDVPGSFYIKLIICVCFEFLHYSKLKNCLQRTFAETLVPTLVLENFLKKYFHFHFFFDKALFSMPSTQLQTLVLISSTSHDGLSTSFSTSFSTLDDHPDP